MMECWDLNPNNRPTFSIIVERIQSFFSFSEVGKYIQCHMDTQGEDI